MSTHIKQVSSEDKDLSVSYADEGDLKRPRYGSVSTSGPGVEHKEHTGLHHLSNGPFLGEEEAIWCRIRRYLQEAFSEFLGVFTLILFGDGVIAQVILSGGTKGDFQSINWCWG